MEKRDLTQAGPKLTVQNLCKDFSGTHVLKDVNFSIEKGEIVSILGASGCGKTTILRILIGLIEPTGGTIIKDGQDITNLPSFKRGMGIVFQNYALFENMTVLGNVEYALKRDKSRRATARQTAMQLIERVGLKDYVNQKPYRLSGGQQQRVAIARTLAFRPDIILLDEPMSALDAATRLSLYAELQSLQKEFDTTMIYITHDQEEAIALSDRIIVMNEGTIQQMDTPQNIINHPANDYVKRFVCDNLRSKIDLLSRFA